MTTALWIVLGLLAAAAAGTYLWMKWYYTEKRVDAEGRVFRWPNRRLTLSQVGDDISYMLQGKQLRANTAYWYRVLDSEFKTEETFSTWSATIHVPGYATVTAKPFGEHISVSFAPMG
jgi:hypothetical protein